MGGPVPNPFGGNKRKPAPAPAPAPAPTPKAEEQPKVEAQMNNSVAGPAGPTDVEMDQENLRQAKRKGRRYSILTSTTGLESKPTLSKKTLLG